MCQHLPEKLVYHLQLMMGVKQDPIKYHVFSLKLNQAQAKPKT